MIVRINHRSPPVATGGLARHVRRGLSLLEVLIALAIFLFSLIALSQLVSIGSDLAVETQWLGRSSMLAQSRLSEVTAGSLPLTSQSETPCDEDPDFNWAIDSEPDAVQGLYRVTVTVSRPKPDGSRFETKLSELVLDPTIRGNTDGTPTGTDSTTPATTTGGTTP